MAALALAAAGIEPIPAGHRAAMMPFGLAAGGPLAPPETWDSLWWDGVAQFYSWRWVLHDALSRGELPLWSPWAFCGQPFAANAQSACFYPVALIVCRLSGPARALGWLWAIHVCIALLLTWGLTRRLGGGDLAGSVAGTLYATGGFMLAWAPVPSLMQSAAWLPGALWGIEAALHERRWLGAVGAAVCLAASALAGHMQIAGFVWLTAALWAAGRLCLRAVRRKPTPVLTLSFAFALAALLAAPQLLPTAELVRLSPRGLQRPSPEGFTFTRALALKPFHLATAVWPTALGSPRSGTYLGHAFAEHFCGLGPLALPLVFAGLWLRRRLKWAWVMLGLAAVALWTAAAGLPARLVYFHVPLLGQAGGFQRTLFIFCLAFSVLAGLGAGAIAGDCCDPRARRARPGAAAVLAAAIALQASFMVWAILPLSPARLLRVSDPVTEWLQARTGPEARVLAVTPRSAWTLRPRPRAIYPPNTLTPLAIQDLQGYDSLYPAICKSAFARVDGCDPSPATNGNMVLIENAAAPAVGEMATEFVVAIDPIGSPRLEKVAEFAGAGERVFIYRHRDFRPRWSVRCREGRRRAVRLAAADYNRVVLSVGPGPRGDVTLADTPYPGWRAFIDGRPEPWRPLRLPVLGRQVSVPRSFGETEVTFVFWPTTAAVGIFLGLLGICAAVSALTACWRRARL